MTFTINPFPWQDYDRWRNSDGTPADDDGLDHEFDEALRSVLLPPAMASPDTTIFESGLNQDALAAEGDPARLASGKTRYLRLPPSFRYCEILDPGLNACVFKHDGRYIVALNLGLKTSCQLLSRHLLHNKHFLPGIGNSAGEEEFLPLPRIRPGDRQAIRSAAKVRPKCDIRLRAGDMLYSSMLSFVVQHERFHVLRGHLDLHLAQGATGMTEAADIGSILASNSECRIAQEFDADGCAVANLVRAWKSRAEQLGTSYPGIDWAKYSTPMAALAGYCVMGLFDSVATVSDGVQTGYPSLSVRRLCAITAAVAVDRFGTENELQPYPFREVFEADATVIYRVIRNSEPPWVQGKVSEEARSEVNADIDRCFALWQKHRSEHEPYAYIRLDGW